MFYLPSSGTRSTGPAVFPGPKRLFLLLVLLPILPVLPVSWVLARHGVQWSGRVHWRAAL